MLSIIITAVDLFARFLVVEHKDAIRYAADPSVSPQTTPTFDAKDHEATTTILNSAVHTVNNQVTQPTEELSATRDMHLSLIGVLKFLLRSVRALTVMYNTLVYG